MVQLGFWSQSLYEANKILRKEGLNKKIFFMLAYVLEFKLYLFMIDIK